MSKTFRPRDYQTPLNSTQLIVRNSPRHDDQVPMNVLFVGAGPAGLAGAIELSRLVKKEQETSGALSDVQIGVLEKASSLGGHNLSGAVVNPRAFRELFPELSDKDFPFRGPVKGDRFYRLSASGHLRLPTPPTMNNHGNYVASICEIVRWLGEKAEAAGVNLFTSFPADSLMMEGKKVVGVRTTSAGLKRDGTPGPQHMPPTEITADITVLTEGTRGPLTQAYLKENKISSKYEQIYALGVKEVWKVKRVPENVIHTLDWPLPKTAFGGSFFYPLDGEHVAIGLVVGMDYKDHNLDVHGLLQKLKTHPLFSEYLQGGECIEWGAKTIPEGGFNALPEIMHGDGLLMAGDCIGFVNVPALKGIHYAMQSGIYAARTAFEALKTQDFTTKTLNRYDQMIKDSYIWNDLKKVRNLRHAFKDGFYMGGIKAGLMTLSGGTFPGDSTHHEEDAAEFKTVHENTTHEKLGLSKVDAVYKAGNKTRDDIPSHLTVGKDIPKEVAEMYVSMCPAGVYELQGEKLVVNAPNCVDCKATDVLGPRWQPREGGSGPNYRLM